MLVTRPLSASGAPLENCRNGRVELLEDASGRGAGWE